MAVATDWQFYRSDLSYSEKTEAAYAFIRKAAKDIRADGDGLVIANALAEAGKHLEAHERYLRGCIAMRDAKSGGI